MIVLTVVGLGTRFFCLKLSATLIASGYFFNCPKNLIVLVRAVTDPVQLLIFDSA